MKIVKNMLLYLALGFVKISICQGKIEEGSGADDIITKELQVATNSGDVHKKIRSRCKDLWCLERVGYREEKFYEHKGYEGGIWKSSKRICSLARYLICSTDKGIYEKLKILQRREYSIFCFWCLTGSLTIHGLVNFLRVHEHRLEKLVPSDFSLCLNDLLDQMIELPLPNDLDSPIYLDPYHMDLLAFQKSELLAYPIPKGAYFYKLEEKIQNFSRVVEEKLMLYKNISLGPAGYGRIPKILFQKYKHSFYCYRTEDLLQKKALNLGSKDSEPSCKYFIEPIEESVEDLPVNISNILGAWDIGNTLYPTVVYSRAKNMEISNFILQEHPSYNDFVKISREIKGAGRKVFLVSLNRFIRHVKNIADFHVFVTAIVPFFRPGYLANSMSFYLWIRSSLGIISKSYFIITAFVVGYMIRILPLRFSERGSKGKNKEFFTHLLLKIRPNICYLESEKELYLTYILGEIVKKQEEMKLVLAGNFALLKSFSDQFCSTTNNTLSNSTLPCTDTFLSLENDILSYREILDKNFFSYDFKYIPAKNVSNSTQNLTGALCGNPFDSRFVLPFLEEVRNNYRITFYGMPPYLSFYFLTPVIIGFFIISGISLIAPIARYGGGIIGYDQVQKVEIQKHIDALLRRRSIIPFLISFSLLIALFSFY